MNPQIKKEQYNQKYLELLKDAEKKEKKTELTLTFKISLFDSIITKCQFDSGFILSFDFEHDIRKQSPIIKCYIVKWKF